MYPIKTLNVNFSVFPYFETERLVLCKMDDSDANIIHRLRTDPLIIQYFDRDPDADMDTTIAKMEEIKLKQQNNDSILWMIELRNQPSVPIGNIGFYELDKLNFRLHLGYSLLPEYWQKGIMKEALITVIDYIFNTCGFHSIEANVNPNNTPSIKLLESCGFRREAYFKQNIYHRGRFVDTVIYTLLAGE